MKWQDWILTLGTWVFIVALVPSLRSSDKPALATSLITGLTMIAFAIVYASYHLWVSTVSAVMLSGEWLVLGWQKHRQHINA